MQAISGASVLDQLYFSKMAKDAPFDQLFYTYLALFMIEYALAQTLIEHSVTPDIVLESSLGEFVSATVAGILDGEEALELIVKQAHLIETYCQPGNMLAILHDPSLYQNVPLLHNTSELAAINYDSHFVISGQREQIQKIQHKGMGASLFDDFNEIGLKLLTETAELLNRRFAALKKTGREF